mgnify:CR=1 FL=1
MEILAEDLGYGYCKGLSSRGSECSFPSVLGPARKLYRGLDGQKGMVLQYDGREWFIGETAIKQAQWRYFSLHDNRAEHWTTRILFLALSAALVEGDWQGNIVTGLPVTHYFEQREQLENTMKGAHRVRFSANGFTKELTLIVHKVAVVPQPFGSLLALVLDHRGQLKDDQRELAKARVGVVDIGMHTADYLYVDALEPIPRLSASTDSGLAEMLRASSEGDTRSLFELAEAIRAMTPNGDFRRLRSQYAALILTEIETYLPECDYYVVTGGGGEIIYEELNLERTILAPEPLMANCRGYLKLGRRLWGS